MHLGDGRGTERRGVDVGEQGGEGLFEFGFDDVLDGGEGKGGDLILELGEFVGELGGEEVGAGGGELAELDEGGAEFFAGLTQPFGLTELLQFRLLFAQPAEREAAGTGQGQVPAEIVVAVFEQDRGDVAQAFRLGVGRADLTEAGEEFHVDPLAVAPIPVAACQPAVRRKAIYHVKRRVATRSMRWVVPRIGLPWSS